MGIITALKVSYKYLYMRSLFLIFDEPGGLSKAETLRKIQRRGCKVIEYSDNLIYWMQQKCKKIWMDEDDRYVSEYIIRQYWRKSYILPEIFYIDTNNDIGSASITEKAK